MKIDPENIKKVAKEVCKENGAQKYYDLLCEIFAHLSKQENDIASVRAEYIKDLIDKEWDRQA